MALKLQSNIEGVQCLFEPARGGGVRGCNFQRSFSSLLPDPSDVDPIKLGVRIHRVPYGVRNGVQYGSIEALRRMLRVVDLDGRAGWVALIILLR